MEHRDESRKRRRIFLINTSKKVAELQKPGTKGFKMKVQPPAYIFAYEI